ncbi:hypothetical protein CLF_102956 [Clonorchis sinensis]|uniref:Uncharacterized protein n=1 Tax=Clonorchis sinensis TaxID=79923 RepID=G7Y8V4_CLOSI|nr:hypothetical protein CLF_102956 [Clonorchis sinensis]
MCSFAIAAPRGLMITIWHHQTDYTVTLFHPFKFEQKIHFSSAFNPSSPPTEAQLQASDDDHESAISTTILKTSTMVWR